MIDALPLEIRKVGRSFAICAGCSVLARFRNEGQAVAHLAANEWFYRYWADSPSVIGGNTVPRVIKA
jgi:hypothetical protein